MSMLCTILHIFVNMKLFQSQNLSKFKEASSEKSGELRDREVP